MGTCPVCSGESFADHPAGWLAWDHRVTCGLRGLEDATQAADHSRGPGVRPATAAERTLLVALGVLAADYAEPVVTNVERVTSVILRRSWPELEPNVQPVS